jgi:hypothetical protein
MMSAAIRSGRAKPLTLLRQMSESSRHIRMVPGSNLGPKTSYPHKGFVDFPVYPAKGGAIPQTGPRLLPHTPFQFTDRHAV